MDHIAKDLTSQNVKLLKILNLQLFSSQAKKTNLKHPSLHYHEVPNHHQVAKDLTNKNDRF